MKVPVNVRAVYEAERSKNLSYATILGEFIDNSFDAGASMVLVSLDNDTLSVTDNGRGCEDFNLILGFGNRMDREETALGRYGYGAKAAILNAGDIVSIQSICNGYARSTKVDWSKIESTQDGCIDTGSELKCLPFDGPSETRIRIKSLRKSHNIKTAEALREMLSVRYRVGLLSGRSIEFKYKDQAVKIAPMVCPNLSEVQEDRFEIDGHSAWVKLGIIADGEQTKHRGIFVEYDFRTIIERSSIGLGDNPPPGVIGWISLDQTWPLTTYKNDIASRDLKEKLNDTIEKWASGLIARARTRTETRDFVRIENIFNEIVGGFHECEDGPPDKRARRPGPKGKHGTQVGTKSARGHKSAAATQRGDRFGSGRCPDSGPLRISFSELPDDSAMFQVINNVVHLNTRHPEVSEKRDDEDAIFRHAAHIFASHFCHREEYVGRLFPEIQEFDERYAKMVSAIIGKIRSQKMVAT